MKIPSFPYLKEQFDIFALKKKLLSSYFYILFYFSCDSVNMSTPDAVISSVCSC